LSSSYYRENTKKFHHVIIASGKGDNQLEVSCEVPVLRIRTTGVGAAQKQAEAVAAKIALEQCKICR
jgi:hypothetical protein